MGGSSEHFRGSISVPVRPLGAAAKPLEIFFRGYLANLRELAHQVGCRHTSEIAPLEVIAEGYERWGFRLPLHLDGQFALVIVDRRTGEALLTHDALGVVPLFWSLEAGTLRFATRIRDLVDSAARNNLDLREVRRYLIDGVSTSDATAYSTIKRLVTGCSVCVRNGSVLRDTYWKPWNIEPIRYKRPEEYLEKFLGLVQHSVQGALLDCDSPWLSLSGGLDSNTLLAPALKSSANLRAFSIVAPQWPDADESKWIKRIVARHSIPWHTINAEDILPFGAFPKTFCGSPDTIVLNQRVVDALDALFGADVVLTGDGGDSFMGSQMGPVPSHLADPLFDGQYSALLPPLRHWQRASMPRRPSMYWLYHAVVLPSVRHLLRRSVRMPHYHLLPDWLLSSRHPIRRSKPAQPRAVAPHCQTPGQQAILDDLWQCAEDSNPNDGGHVRRHPLFNRPLFEFLWAVPWSQKNLPQCDRYLQRRALKGLMDDDIRTRIGFGTGSRSLIEGLRRAVHWQQFLCERPALAEHGLVDADRWRRAIARASVGQTGAEAVLLRAITVEVWLKQLAKFQPGRIVGAQRLFPQEM